MNEWMMYLYSAFLCFVVHPKHFKIMRGGLSSTTTSVQHPLGWCEGCHNITAPVRSPHTSYRWRGERDKETIKCMRSHTPATGGEERESWDNQVYALTTHQLQVERRESHRDNQVYALTTHQLRWRGETSHRANQVYVLTTHQLQVERRET